LLYILFSNLILFELLYIYINHIIIYYFPAITYISHPLSQPSRLRREKVKADRVERSPV